MRSVSRGLSCRGSGLSVFMVSVVTVLSSCGSTRSGDAATWDVHAENSPTGYARTFTAYVTRLGCSNGRTGDVLTPIVRRSQTEVVVTFTVAATSGFQLCPSNDAVPVVVDIGEPIGHRVLVDGACGPGGAALSLPPCHHGGTRWTP